MKKLCLSVIICWVSVAYGVQTDNEASLSSNAATDKRASVAVVSKAAPQLDRSNIGSQEKPAVEDELSYIPAKQLRHYGHHARLRLRSEAALVYDERDKEIILARHAHRVMPIASLSKLVTAMVILDASLPMQKVITIRSADKDRIRYSRSRLRNGMRFRREDLLLLALLASENRAALALARTYPGSTATFVKAMNHKCHELGLLKTHFSDPAGLGNGNVSTANELMKIVKAASHYPLIHEFTTQSRETVTDLHTGRDVKFGNTNRLVRKDSWPIRLSKTGFTNDAGNCLVMQTQINERPVIIVLLDSWGKLSKYGDSNRIKKWLIRTERYIEKHKTTDSI